MSQRRVVIHGCYNSANFGDLLLLDLVARHVEERHGTRPICPWPPPRGVTPDAHAIMAARGRGLVSCVNAAAAIFGGGGYLADRGTPASARRLLRYTVPARLWRALGTPFVVVGVGVGPLISEAGRRRIRPMCDGARRVCVRDEESKAILLESGVRPELLEATADLVLAMTEADLPEEAVAQARSVLGPRKPGVRRVGFHLQLVGKYEPILPRLIQEAGRVLAGRDDIEVLWLADHSDSFFDLVRRHGGESLPGARFIPRQEHWTTAALLGELDAVFTTKLHVGIAAWALKVPACGFSINPKTERLYRQIGRSQFQCPATAPVERVGEWLDLFVKDPTAFAAEDASARDRLPRLAKRNYEVVDELLAGALPAAETGHATGTRQGRG